MKLSLCFYVLLDGNVVVLVGRCPGRERYERSVVGRNGAGGFKSAHGYRHGGFVVPAGYDRRAPLPFHGAAHAELRLASHVMRVLTRRLRQMNSLARTPVSINRTDD
jgi:hypothetical protein